jgi:hypothetical protein
VLVDRLLYVAASHLSLDSLLSALGRAPADYFHEFVETLLLREVNEKWIDRQGDAATPLITLEQHEELLGLLAQEMWISATEVLRQETLDLLSDLFAEGQGLSPVQAHQIRERLPQHSLLTTQGQSRPQYGFDHEDFRKYFLGQAIGRAIQDQSSSDIRTLLRAGVLPSDTCDAIVRFVARSPHGLETTIRLIADLGSVDSPAGFARENCGALIVRLLDGLQTPMELSSITFPPDALRGRLMFGHVFKDCYFPSTSLDGTVLIGVRFEHCRLDSLELTSTTRIERTRLLGCTIQSVAREVGDIRTFDPDLIYKLLSHAGFGFDEDVEAKEVPAPEYDQEIELIQRLLRTLFRATQVSEETLRKRFGTRGNQFMEDVLPELLRVRFLDETVYAGGGQGRRFKLAIPMQAAEEALALSVGGFQRFLSIAQARADRGRSAGSPNR